MKLRSPEGKVEDVKSPLEVTNKMQAGWVFAKENKSVEKPVVKERKSSKPNKSED